MRRLWLAGTCVLAMCAVQAATPPATDARAKEIIRTLKLTVLPKESGYLGIIGVSAQKVDVGGRMLAVQSQNYYMLTHEKPINYLHWLALGFDYAAGERPVVAVPGGCWKALSLREGAKYVLMVNTLSPEFTPDRVKIGEGAAWVKRFSGTASWATPEMLREFIGPNWIP